MNDKIIAKGEVDIMVYENDLLIDRFIESNLVVTLGKTNITKLMGGDAAGTKISKIGVGTSGIATDVANTVLTGMFSKALDSVSYPDAQSVMFHFDIDNGEANGMSIREFGLLNDGNVLCARKIRDADIVKTIAIRLVGTWKITVN